MLSRILLGCMLSIYGFATLAQSDQEVLAKVQQQAQVMSDAFHNQEFDTFLDFTHPHVIEGIGGRKKMKSFLKKGFDTEIGFVKTDVRQAKNLIKTQNTWQCAMKQDQIIKVNGKEYLVQGYLIGISYDAGKEWKYISVSNNTLQGLQQVFPELSDKLKVKPQKEPRLRIKTP